MSDETDIAYCAGLFEGEGWVNGKTGTNTWRLGINMTDLEPLERVRLILGGKINGPYDRSAHGATKPIYSWVLHGYGNVDRVFMLLESYLSPRRVGQFRKALSIEPRVIQPCGTYGGYQRHWRKGEKACVECLLASAQYRKSRRNQ